jgi:IS30 family transposase
VRVVARQRGDTSPFERRAAAVRAASWVLGSGLGACTDHGRNSVLTLVESATGYTAIGTLERHAGRVATITADNGTEFHSYKQIEAATDVEFYFATPHHSWERGTNENTNGLIRQYLPKRTSFADVTQMDCDAIAAKLNSRPRKRHGYRTPEECYARS